MLGQNHGYSSRVATSSRAQEFVALGHAGSEHYAGLETFPNPGVTRVEMTSDELTAVCPITGQPDL
jgi:NADPH-dependent 7-cyano-7-deazaguanine reductase QueF